MPEASGRMVQCLGKRADADLSDALARLASSTTINPEDLAGHGLQCGQERPTIDLVLTAGLVD